MLGFTEIKELGMRVAYYCRRLDYTFLYFCDHLPKETEITGIYVIFSYNKLYSFKSVSMNIKELEI